ncbi:hypothetical protein ADUPG1_012137 [Aduncisulcus paluster]|uniref:Transposase n=1 Tax=Aduncisulcus paluster TaxID=2918883 RepID=A0ABQ5K287_9EUKA|nr:hypothetical protein ADUPG1_012137 [Aduncisulcus paluster]
MSDLEIVLVEEGEIKEPKSPLSYIIAFGKEKLQKMNVMLRCRHCKLSVGHVYSKKWSSKWKKEDFSCHCSRYLVDPMMTVITHAKTYSMGRIDSRLVLTPEIHMKYEDLVSEYHAIMNGPANALSSSDDSSRSDLHTPPIVIPVDSLSSPLNGDLFDDFGPADYDDMECVIESSESDISIPQSLPWRPCQDLSAHHVSHDSLIDIPTLIDSIKGRLSHAAKEIFDRTLTRDLSDSFSRTIRSRMLLDKKEFDITCSLPPIERIHELRRRVMQSSRECSFTYSGKTINFRWQNIGNCSNTHVRTQMGIATTLAQLEMSSVDRKWQAVKEKSFSEYINLCKSYDLTPVFIAPLLVFMDGVMTCRAGHTALCIRWTLANLRDDFKTKNAAWTEIAVVAESGQIATSAFLTQLVADAKLLQQGFEITINGTTVRIYGTLFHIIADGKQITDNIGTKHSSKDPCQWCDLKGTGLLLGNITGKRRHYSEIVSERTSTEDVHLHLPLWSAYMEGKILFSPLTLHTGDMLHVEDLGNSHEYLRQLCYTIWTQRYGEEITVFYPSSEEECRYDFSPLLMSEDEEGPTSVTTGGVSRLTTEKPTRRYIKVKEHQTSLDSVTSYSHLTFHHLLLMCILNDIYGLQYGTASTLTAAKETQAIARRHRDILIPLCLKAGIIVARTTQGSNETIVKKSKTHFVSHLPEWVSHCGPMAPFSAQPPSKTHSCCTGAPIHQSKIHKTSSTRHKLCYGQNGQESDWEAL